jgi:hypothetical protein
MSAQAWGLRHTDRAIGEAALRGLLAVVAALDLTAPDVRVLFFKKYSLATSVDLFKVLTDRMHKSCA